MYLSKNNTYQPQESERKREREVKTNNNILYGNVRKGTKKEKK